MSPNDGYIVFDSLNLEAGDHFVVLAGSYTFGSSPDFNLLLYDPTFDGAVRLSDMAALVQEPSALLLSCLAMPLFMRRKR